MRSKYIDKNAHYFILTRPMDYVPILGMYFGKTYGAGCPEVWAEFEVIEERYKVDDGYKVELRAINPVFGRESYYQGDFDGLIDAGLIVKKTSENQHIEKVTWMEPLCGNVKLVHTASVLVDESIEKVGSIENVCPAH